MFLGCKLGLSYRDNEEENVRNYFSTDPNCSFCVFDKSSDNFMKPSSQNMRSATKWRSLLQQHSPAVLRVLFVYQGLPSVLMKDFQSAWFAKTEAVIIIDETNFPSDLLTSVLPYLSLFTKPRRTTQAIKFLDSCAMFLKK